MDELDLFYHLCGFINSPEAVHVVVHGGVLFYSRRVLRILFDSVAHISVLWRKL